MNSILGHNKLYTFLPIHIISENCYFQKLANESKIKHLASYKVDTSTNCTITFRVFFIYHVQCGNKFSIDCQRDQNPN